MADFGTWGVQQARFIKDFGWDFAPMPLAKEGYKRVTPMFQASYCVAELSKYKDEAIKFARFYAKDFAQKEIGVDGLITPFLRSAANSEEFLKLEGAPEHHYLRLEGLEYAILADILHTQVFEITRLIGTATEQITLGKKTAEEALKEVVPQIDDILKK